METLENIFQNTLQIKKTNNFFKLSMEALQNILQEALSIKKK